jgi:predicted small lipoprotein YifL
MKPLPFATLLVAAATAATLSACGPKGPATIPVLDVTKTYPAKTLTLQDIATVEYIPLETREGFLVDYLTVSHMDDRRVITFNQAGDIMVFDRHTGKGLQSFNRKGRGPIEYTGIFAIAVDEARGEMFVTPNSISSGDYPIYVYGLDGKPLRTHQFKTIQFPEFFHSYDDDRLFFYNNRTSNTEPYGLISKTDTLVTYLPVKFEGRANMFVSQRTENGYRGMRQGDPIAKTRDGYMLSEPGIDTMFRWNRADESLTPVMTRTPAFNSMETPIGLFFLGENNDYMFLRSIERKYDFEAQKGFDMVDIFYDKRGGEFYGGKIVNADFADERQFTPQVSAALPAGVTVVPLQPYMLLDLHEQGKLRGRLAEIAPTLKEEDNPVMMIVTFK